MRKQALLSWCSPTEISPPGQVPARWPARLLRSSIQPFRHRQSEQFAGLARVEQPLLMNIRRFAASLVLAMGLGPGSPVAPQAATNATVAPPQAALASTRLSGASLQADAAILRRAYEALHPGLHRYNTPAQIDAAFRALESEFQQDRTLADAYLAFSVLAAKVKCGHTYANFFNQSSTVQAALFQGPRIPFHFRWLGDRMIVTRSFASDPRLRAGTEVLALNGQPVAEILARLMTVARADGNNDAKRVAYLQVDGLSRYEAFDIFCSLFFPSDSPWVTLRVRAPEAPDIQTVQAPAATYAGRLAAVAASNAPGAAPGAPLWSCGCSTTVWATCGCRAGCSTTAHGIGRPHWRRPSRPCPAEVPRTWWWIFAATRAAAMSAM